MRTSVRQTHGRVFDRVQIVVEHWAVRSTSRFTLEWVLHVLRVVQPSNEVAVRCDGDTDHDGSGTEDQKRDRHGTERGNTRSDGFDELLSGEPESAADPGRRFGQAQPEPRAALGTSTPRSEPVEAVVARGAHRSGTRQRGGHTACTPAAPTGCNQVLSPATMASNAALAAVIASAGPVILMKSRPRGDSMIAPRMVQFW